MLKTAKKLIIDRNFEIIYKINSITSNSITMGCLPIRRDNPQALASVLSYVQVDKHHITISSTFISIDLAHHEIFCAKVGKRGIYSKIAS